LDFEKFEILTMPVRYGEPICITKPNFVPIGQIVAVFFDILDILLSRRFCCDVAHVGGAYRK